MLTIKCLTRTSIAEWLNMSEARPWMALKRGKKVTAQWLAQQLQTYGIRPKTMRIGEERAKGYEFEDFQEAFRRYVPRGELEEFKAEIVEQAARSKEQAAAGAENTSVQSATSQHPTPSGGDGKSGEQQRGEERNGGK